MIHQGQEVFMGLDPEWDSALSDKNILCPTLWFFSYNFPGKFQKVASWMSILFIFKIRFSPF